MRSYRLLTALVCALSLSGCAGLQSTFNVLTFRAADDTGITEGQYFVAYMLQASNNGYADQLPPLIRGISDRRFRAGLEACARPRPQAFGGLESLIPGGVAADVVTKAGQLIFKSVISEIEGRRARIEKAATQTYAARLNLAGRNIWSRTNCILTARLTDFDGDDRPESLGMVALFNKQTISSGTSSIVPVYLRLNNGYAATGSGNNPEISLSFTFNTTSVVQNRIVPGEDVEVGALVAAVGRETPVCAYEYAGPNYPCQQASKIFTDPPSNSAGVQARIVVTERGSEAPSRESVAEGTQVIQDITSPIYDELLRRIAEGAKKRGG